MSTDAILYLINGEELLLFDGHRFSAAPTKKHSAYYSAAALPLSLIRTHGFKVPQNISSEKLAIQAEISMYDEGGLNPETDFKIDSLSIPLEHEEMLYVESYAVDIASVRHQFDTFVKKHRLLDVIIPPALCYSALYAFEHLEKKNDLFIHFDTTNAYAVIFKNGRYIATRALSNISDLAEKLGVDVAKTRELLTTKGVRNDSYTPDEFLLMHTIQEELSKIVERIAHSISHKRGIFRLDHIDRFFIDFEGADIPGFLSMFESYGYEAAAKEVLDVFDAVAPGNKHHALHALYALGGLNQRYPFVNLSIYERKPNILKTHTGQFAMVLSAALILALSYPIYATYEIDTLTQRETQLQAKVSDTERRTQQLRTQLKQERSKRDALKQEYAVVREHLRGYDHMLDALQGFETEKLARQQMMKAVNIALRDFTLSSKFLEQNGSAMMNIHIITAYEHRDNIAKFMKALIAKGYAHVETRKIERDDTLYESLVEIRP
ncbi:MAG: hypothetical protein DSZ03_07655 [Sulfurimonas sp.]|nr:MAG: hypothetical protein DSZ03_07655 [Sulfurimonas sp.]